MKTKNNFLKFANSFQAVAHLELEGIKLLLKFLGNPEADLKCIHVAGTNGKGSVCSFLSCILSEAGCKVGKYISPNMLDVTERISINGIDISSEKLENIMSEIKIAADTVEKELGAYPTQFELWTAAAFVYFKKECCDICVIEVGLGGEKDATNVIPHPLFSVITSISMDHMGYLGNTITEIAFAKAGIIKKSCPVITFEQSKEIMSVIKNKCDDVGSGDLITADIPIVSVPKNGHEIISYKSINNIELGICGAYQPQNASLAIEAALQLGISEEHIKSGVLKARNMGRFDIKINSPEFTLIIDGAHNDDGMASLLASLERYFGGYKPVFIMGMMEDKDKTALISHIKNSPLCPKKIYTVTIKENPRAMDAINLANLFLQNGLQSVSCGDISEAFTLASKEKLCVICGSLYLYKDFHEFFDGYKFND